MRPNCSNEVRLRVRCPAIDTPASGESIMRELIGKCDAVLRIGGPSSGADDMVATGERLGKRIFRDLSELPERRR